MLKGLLKGQPAAPPGATETPLRRALRQRLTLTLREVGQRFPVMRPAVLALGGKALQYLESLTDAELRQLVTVLHEESDALYGHVVNDPN